MKKLLLVATCLISGMLFAQQQPTTATTADTVMGMLATLYNKLKAQEEKPAVETKPTTIWVEKEVKVEPTAAEAAKAAETAKARENQFDWRKMLGLFGS